MNGKWKMVGASFLTLEVGINGEAKGKVLKNPGGNALELEIPT